MVESAPPAPPSPPPPPAPRARRRRADAQRNRERLLTEADAVFQEQGTQASLERIARRAGVAIGTLYAHFPSRRALLGELLAERQQRVFDAADELLGQEPPASPRDALVSWMHVVAEYSAVYSGLAEQLLGSLDDEDSALHTACRRVAEAGERLVERAHAAGEIRADVTAEDVFALINAAAWLRGRLRDPAAAERVTSVICGGLSAPAAQAPATD
ncbi:TetR/AcrR family transcriptional regulator [Streptomyces sp. AJS327]|uniref:TetR/AcrR family transcriptional regulator n=1 Tax=Streptomyces sp. AJS327 TaxID=2545265 RepID=UPI0015DDCAC8|nr:TetR/AcrR family transcriptional regulator [Streptomyces sp. AJS327]MBA0050678.1 TetR/AcrR family transcriptional regulator [Streptomyces sp. AJS327]